MRIREAIKDLLPASLLAVLREQRARVRARRREIVRCFRTRRQFADNALGADVVAMLRFVLWPRKTILFFPEPPCHWPVEYKLCVLLGYAITANPHRPFDVAFKRKDTTVFDPAVLHKIPTSRHRIINARSIDVSKHAVSKAFAEVFGYSLEVDSLQYHGKIVEKSDENATHDGRVLEGPLAPADVRPGCIYQKAIDNTAEQDGLVLDYRVPIYGEQIPLVYLKYRPLATRFSNTNAFVEVREPESVFTPKELAQILELARKMGVDYGEFDVLRDKDKRIYVVDVNNTPTGPPNGLPEREAKRALERLTKSFERFLELWEVSSPR
jgi:hypothetical protein